jgi:hypothetical protein
MSSANFAAKRAHSAKASAVMRRVSNHRIAGHSEPEQGSRRFSCCSNRGDPVVTDKPDKPEQITPAKITVTDTGIAPYIFFEGAPDFSRMEL